MSVTSSYNYTLDFSNYKIFYSKRSASPTGISPHVDTPNAGGCIISRLIHDLILMNKIDKDKCDKQVIYSASGGKSIVSWEQENEETCVNFKKLIGFSEGIKFKLLVAITPGALACSTILTGCAVGTGLMLFEANGPATSCNSDSGSFPHDRLIVWSRSSVFEFVSNFGLADCYLSSTYLKPTNGAKFVIDSDTERRGSFSTFTKLLKKIYLP